jgi:hypothetical protein
MLELKQRTANIDNHSKAIQPMTQIDKRIANEIAKANGVTVAKLGLRFDKVVVRLLGGIRIAIEQEVSKEVTFMMTITAAIKLPAKTEYELIGKINDFLGSGIQHQDSILTIFQNEVRLRIVKSSSKQTTKFVGLVHNPDIDSKLLLDLAAQWLLKV